MNPHKIVFTVSAIVGYGACALIWILNSNVAITVGKQILNPAPPVAIVWTVYLTVQFLYFHSVAWKPPQDAV